MQDEYKWQVTYLNGTTLNEEDAAQGFASVDQLHVKSVALIREGFVIHEVQVPPTAQGVFFRRHRVVLNVQDDSVVNRKPTHCIGWRQGEQAVYLFIRSDGTTLLSNDLQAG